jgi:hypothetical protein
MGLPPITLGSNVIRSCRGIGGETGAGENERGDGSGRK